MDGEYQSLESAPEGTPQQIGETPELPPTEFATEEINAEGAAPEAQADASNVQDDVVDAEFTDVTDDKSKKDA